MQVRRLGNTAKLALGMVVFLLLNQTAYALSGVYHRPYGKDDIYVTSASNTDRWPLDPYAGQIEYVKVTTWPIESGDSVVVNWSKNNDGIARQASASWQVNSGNNSYWQAAICDPNHSTGGVPDTCNEGDYVTWQMTQNAAAAVMPGASDTGYGWDGSSHLFFSNNIWEDTYGEFLYTNASIVAGLGAAANIATIEGNSTLATNWNNQANDIWNNGIGGTITGSSPLTTPGMYDSDVGRYVFARNIRKTRTDGPALILNPISADVSQLGPVWPFNITPANDSRMQATASEIKAGLGDTAECGSTAGIARYRHNQNSRYSPNGNPDYSPFNDTYFDGGPWTVATLWLADYDLQLAQSATGKTNLDAGKQYLDTAIGWMGPLYIGSEQVDHLAGQQPDGSWLKQAAWPNLWESNASVADTLMMFLDYKWNATTNTLVMKPKIPSAWSAVGGNITIVANGASSQKVYVKHQHPGGSSPDTITFNNNTTGTTVSIDLYVQTDFNPGSVTGLGSLTWSYDATSGRVRIQGATAPSAAYTITINR